MGWTGAGLELATKRPIDSGWEGPRAAQAGGSLLSAPGSAGWERLTTWSFPGDAFPG